VWGPKKNAKASRSGIGGHIAVCSHVVHCWSRTKHPEKKDIIIGRAIITDSHSIKVFPSYSPRVLRRVLIFPPHLIGQPHTVISLARGEAVDYVKRLMSTTGFGSAVAITPLMGIAFAGYRTRLGLRVDDGRKTRMGRSPHRLKTSLWSILPWPPTCQAPLHLVPDVANFR
jgi:hypothetical protein